LRSRGGFVPIAGDVGDVNFVLLRVHLRGDAIWRMLEMQATARAWARAAPSAGQQDADQDRDDPDDDQELDEREPPASSVTPLRMAHDSTSRCGTDGVSPRRAGARLCAAARGDDVGNRTVEIRRPEGRGRGTAG
jgi:hypothetical protein